MILLLVRGRAAVLKSPLPCPPQDQMILPLVGGQPFPAGFFDVRVSPDDNKTYAIWKINLYLITP